MSLTTTSLTAPRAAPLDQLELEACLRRVLMKMASALDEAYDLYPHGGVASLVMAKRCAALIDTGLDEDDPAVGAWFVSGPYAGLSIVSGVLSNMDLPTAFENLQALAELRFHAQDLMLGVSPFADEMHHAGFQETYQRLLPVLEESRAM